MSVSWEPGSVIEPLPIFPLPGVVFFPGTLLPLHVFETRYRKLTRDALAGSRCMTVALIPDPSQSDELGQPLLAPLAGAGEIVSHQELPDGRHNIVLLGRARVRLQELPFEPPYRRARGTVECDAGAASETDVAALTSTATRFAGMLRQRDPAFDLALPATREPGALVDSIASALVIEAAERQEILEILDVGERIQKCCATIAIQELVMRRGA
jgi:Lon protease-like protein